MERILMLSLRHFLQKSDFVTVTGEGQYCLDGLSSEMIRFFD